MTYAQQKLLKEHNQLMDANFRILRGVRRAKRGASMEHPADPGSEPYASVWNTPEFQQLALECELTVASFDQCRLGATSRKPTSLASSSPSVRSWEELVCTHGSHPGLIGRGPDGNFKTKQAQAYPPEFCRRLAQLHLDEFLARKAAEPEEETSEGLPLPRGAEEAAVEALAPLVEPGDHLPIPPIGWGWDPLPRWSEVCRWRWKTEEHINILECRAVLTALRRIARSMSSWGRRIMIFVDSQVTLCALSKGRSSRAQINHTCRRACACVLAFDLSVVYRWVPSKRNHADGPSRGCPVGVAPEPVVQPRRAAAATAASAMPEAFRQLAG